MPAVTKMPSLSPILEQAKKKREQGNKHVASGDHKAAVGSYTSTLAFIITFLVDFNLNTTPPSGGGKKKKKKEGS